jgi:nucleoside-diphosphate-sugar epimerase
VIFYNGASGGLGRYMHGIARDLKVDTHILETRLEDSDMLPAELQRAREESPVLRDVTLLQLAAMVSVPECEHDPELAYQINVTDTLSYVDAFLSWAENENVRARVIYVSTGHVYAENKGHNLKEGDPVGPRSIYAKTKLEAELQLQKLAMHNDVPLTIARVFGLLAPAQPPHYVLPSLIKRVRENNLAAVPGLHNVRDYLDARDVCQGLLSLCQLEKAYKGILNLCSERKTEIADLLKEIIKQSVPADKQQQVLDGISAGETRPDDISYIVGSRQQFDTVMGASLKMRPLAVTIHDALIGAKNS